MPVPGQNLAPNLYFMKVCRRGSSRRDPLKSGRFGRWIGGISNRDTTRECCIDLAGTRGLTKARAGAAPWSPYISPSRISERTSATIGGQAHEPVSGASVLDHNFVVHRTALQVSGLGARPAVMRAHHKGRATTTEGPARPPAASPFPTSGGRQGRLTMSGIACAALPTQRSGKAILWATKL